MAQRLKYRQAERASTYDGSIAAIEAAAGASSAVKCLAITSLRQPSLGGVIIFITYAAVISTRHIAANVAVSDSAARHAIALSADQQLFWRVEARRRRRHHRPSRAFGNSAVNRA